MTSRGAIRWIAKPLIWAAALAPLIWLGWRAAQEDLGANPIEKVTHETGLWALILLMATLAVTPLRGLTGWNPLVQVRRLLGLFAFFYATLHFLTYVVLDQFFAWEYIVEDIAERPYITVGFAAFVLLIPLAATSTRGMIRRLGRRWQSLHRLIYVAAAFAVLHFLWLVKADTSRPVLFAVILLVLLAARLPLVRSRRAQRPLSAARPRPRASASTART